nr:MAG TPA: hypothetical protein [Myoviridae sp. ctRUJ25]DAR93929.1 MAG TPA: hypothetical protein [Caudoviricetes sp.]
MPIVWGSLDLYSTLFYIITFIITYHFDSR